MIALNSEGPLVIAAYQQCVTEGYEQGYTIRHAEDATLKTRIAA